MKPKKTILCVDDNEQALSILRLGEQIERGPRHGPLGQHVLASERDLDRAVERLITGANEEGGVDNISVVLARVEAA